ARRAVAAVAAIATGYTDQARASAAKAAAGDQKEQGSDDVRMWNAHSDLLTGPMLNDYWLVYQLLPGAVPSGHLFVVNWGPCQYRLKAAAAAPSVPKSTSRTASGSFPTIPSFRSSKATAPDPTSGGRRPRCSTRPLQRPRAASAAWRGAKCWQARKLSTRPAAGSPRKPWV